MFNAFRTVYNHRIIWPPTPYQLTQFIAYLAIHKYSLSTAKSYLAGISFYCKISDVSDTTQSFIVKKTLLGYCRSKVQTDDHKPITLDILRKIIVALPSVCTSYYEASLFSAIFTTAFFGYFRIGELVQNTSKEVGHAIQTSNVIYIASNNTIQISLKHSKTDQEGKGSLINLLPTNNTICPVSSITSFMSARPHCPGSFFCHARGTPVTRYQVMSVFSMFIAKFGLDTKSYKTHSFRIGAATDAWVQGRSEDQIAAGGRWKSKCLHRYIKCEINYEIFITIGCISSIVFIIGNKYQYHCRSQKNIFSSLDI